MPAWNAEATLEFALRSIFRQTLQDWECIVVDDGSDDSSRLILDRWAKHDERFIPLYLEHRGLVAALNAGLRKCRGDIVFRMDADDLMHRNRLESQITRFACDPELVALGGHVRIFPRKDLKEGMRNYESWINGISSEQELKKEAFVECPIAHPTLAIRRKWIQDFGYRDQGWPEDYDLVLRLLGYGAKVGVVPERLLSWRNASQRLSQTHKDYGIDRFTACKAEFLARDFLKDSDQYVLWGYGGTGKALRKALLKHGKRPAFIVELHPGRLGEVIHGAPVIEADRLLGVQQFPVVVSVAGATARLEIRSTLASMGFVELRDYRCAA